MMKGSTSRWPWALYRGEGYLPNPMTHGPFQIITVAFTYFLFGASDFSSRIPAALFGVAAVALLYFFRRWLGRAGALAAGLPDAHLAVHAVLLALRAQRIIRRGVGAAHVSGPSGATWKPGRRAGSGCWRPPPHCITPPRKPPTFMSPWRSSFYSVWSRSSCVSTHGEAPAAGRVTFSCRPRRYCWRPWGLG